MIEVSIEEKVTLSDTTDKGVALSVHNDRLWLAWIGENNHQLNVMGGTIVGERSINFDQLLKQVMGDTSDFSPALRSFNGRLWIAWTGRGNKQLNVMGSLNGNDFDTNTKQIMGDTSDAGPALGVFQDRLWIAWAGEDNRQLNVMGSLSGNDFDLGTKQIMGDTTDGDPALCPFGGRLGICWAGVDNQQVNIMTSFHGNDFDTRTKATFDLTSLDSPDMNLFLVPWIAAPQGDLSPKVIKVTPLASGGFVSSDVGVIVSDTFFGRPAMATFRDQVFIAWAGTDEDHHLNIGFLGF